MRPRPCSCDRFAPGDRYTVGCVACWTWHHRPALRAAFGDSSVPAPPAAAAVAQAATVSRRRPLPCLHLGRRTEFRPGCDGSGCRHDCELRLPAVPGVFCQACPKYEADD